MWTMSMEGMGRLRYVSIGQAGVTLTNGPSFKPLSNYCLRTADIEGSANSLTELSFLWQLVAYERYLNSSFPKHCKSSVNVIFR